MGMKGLLATAYKGFKTAGTTGRLIAPETLKLQGQGVSLCALQTCSM